MRIARHAAKLAVFVVAGAMVLASCAKSSTSTGSISGAFGTVPPPSGTPHVGKITVAEPPGATPTWIFPVTPSANNSVYTISSFQDEMWRPLYWDVNGVAPTETRAMSLANAPVYSNGDKTITITLKSNCDLAGDIGRAVLANLHGPRRPRVCARKVKSPLSRWNKHPDGKPRTTHRITSITAHVSAEHHRPATRRRKPVTNTNGP